MPTEKFKLKYSSLRDVDVPRFNIIERYKLIVLDKPITNRRSQFHICTTRNNNYKTTINDPIIQVEIGSKFNLIFYSTENDNNGYE